MFRGSKQHKWLTTEKTHGSIQENKDTTMLHSPWTFDDYYNKYDLPNHLHNVHINDKLWNWDSDLECVFIDIMSSVSSPDLICKSNIEIGKPRLITLEENNTISQFGKKHELNYSIGFGNTLHTYAINGYDHTPNVWEFIEENDIDYTNMTVDNFNMIKLFLFTQRGNYEI